ncbi:MAG: sigma-70 family RNA polymerase sigma factor, partial [Actinomycetota bacterium]|nr:sigma-70 family RNA polymerase sigma factor [Actinomycetota bacterium]
AAGELFRRTRSRARRAACAFCCDGDADDAVAEGLTRALRRIGELRDPAAVEAWMVRCVVRSAIDLSRQRRRQPPVEPMDALVDATWAGESAAERALSILECDSMAEVVRELQPALRLLLYLRYDAGLSVQHIAVALGKPAGTIRRQCVEARRLAGQRFLGRHLRPAVGTCARVTEMLCREPYRRPANRVRSRASEHLRGCRACQDRQAELAAVLTELGVKSRSGACSRP